MKINIKKLLLLLVIIIIAILILINNKENETVVQEKKENNTVIEEIEQIKQETGMTANEELYEVNVEYDGKKVLNIKPEIQYKIAFAGIMKNKIPELNEIDKIFEDEYPKESGIWIDVNSRNEFLKLLNNVTNNKYEITEQGYLKIEQETNPNDEDNLLKKMIEGENRYIVTISGIYYEADRVSGEIFDNFFEEMDPYQASKIVEWNNNYIVILSTNKEKKLTDKGILQELSKM